MSNLCITCGVPLPEGRQICKECENRENNIDVCEVTRKRRERLSKRSLNLCLIIVEKIIVGFGIEETLTPTDIDCWVHWLCRITGDSYNECYSVISVALETFDINIDEI